jgi:hypothetical protein
MPDEDEELAIEFLTGVPGPNGRTYMTPGSEREKMARAALARFMVKEAPNGYFTRLVAAHFDPPPSSAVIKRILNFHRPKRGTPVRRSDRRRVEIAAFMHEYLRVQKEGAKGTSAQARNLKNVIPETQKKFGISRNTVLDIWKDFGPAKRRTSPNKSAI